MRRLLSWAGVRRLLVAALLPGATIVGLAAQSPAPAGADPKAAAGRLPAASQAPDLGADDIRAVLQHLDDCFGRGDTFAYLETFVPDHPGAHAVMARELSRAAAMARRECKSTIVGEPRRLGPRTVVRIHQQLRLENTLGEVAAYDSHAMLALRRDASGRPVPTLLVEFPATTRQELDAGLRCPACNYEIGGAAGWLCVPQRGDRASALEAASFYLLGTDLACDVSVRIDADAPDAVPLAERLAAALAELEPKARLGAASPWLPPAHRQDPPRGLGGARLEVEVADAAGVADAGRAVFHVLTFGGLQHLLLVRGSQRSLAEHAADVDALLASYRLLERDCDLALAAARPLHHHTGGTLDDGRYDNRLHHVVMRGPAGWKGQLRCGGAAFRVSWQSLDGARLWLTGLSVPPGMQQWTSTTADRYLRQLCRQQGLEPPPAAEPGPGATDWIELAGCSTRTRTICCRSAAAATDPAAPALRWIHLQVHGDLLLIADGYAPTTADEVALRSAFETLVRR